MKNMCCNASDINLQIGKFHRSFFMFCLNESHAYDLPFLMPKDCA